MTVYIIYESTEREFVQRVAEKLGRGKAILDRHAFPDGDDLVHTIERLLGDAQFAVFFASASSLEKQWPRLELEICAKLVRSGTMEPPLTILVDVTVDDLPKWLRTSIAHEISTPEAAARAILARTGSKSSDLFVGREDDITNIRKELISRDGPLKVLLFAGLDGIGRRTLARHLLRFALNTSLGQTYTIGETDDLGSVYLRAKEAISHFMTSEELASTATEFRGLLTARPTDAAKELVRVLSLATGPKEALVLVDSRDACFQDSGEFTSEMKLFLAEVKRHPSLLVVIISRRMPRLPFHSSNNDYIVSHRVAPLSREATIELLTLQLKASHTTASKTDIAEIANYLDGYAVAIEWAVNIARRYGISALRRDKTSLVELKTHQFQPFLEKSIGSNSIRKDILRYLAAGSMASLDLLETLTSIPAEALLNEIKILTDLSLVELQNENFVIAAPIRDAVTRLYRHLSSRDHDQIVARIVKRFPLSKELPLPSLDIIEQLLLSSELGAKQVPQMKELRNALPSTVARAAQESYNARDWRRAVKLARSVRTIDGAVVHGKGPYGRQLRMQRIVVKGLVRCKQWNDAEHELKVLEDSGDPKMYYIRGFLESKKGDARRAEASFAQAMKHGDQSVSVIRDRAACLFHLGKVEEARRLLRRLPEHGSSNKYILDLMAKIAISAGDYLEALKIVEQLEALGESDDAAHRRASILAEQRKPREALIEIARISELREAGRSLKASMLIDVKNYSEAERVIGELEAGSLPEEDVKNGLYCKLWLRQGNWRKSEHFYRKLRNKNQPVHKALQTEIERQKSGDLSRGPDLPSVFWEFETSEGSESRIS